MRSYEALRCVVDGNIKPIANRLGVSISRLARQARNPNKETRGGDLSGKSNVLDQLDKLIYAVAPVAADKLDWITCYVALTVCEARGEAARVRNSIEVASDIVREAGTVARLLLTSSATRSECYAAMVSLHGAVERGFLYVAWNFRFEGRTHEHLRVVGRDERPNQCRVLLRAA